MTNRTEELMRLVEAWRPADEAKREAEVQRLAELWSGIEVGDVVELSEGEHVKRGGMLMFDEEGCVLLRQAEVLEIEGDRAYVRGIERWGMSGMEWIGVTEWIERGSIGRVVRAGLKGVRRERVEKRRYWEAG
jgi:hypothetical protein